jgi:hypothetical protein
MPRAIEGARSSLFIQHLPADYCLHQVEERKAKGDKKIRKGRGKNRKRKGENFRDLKISGEKNKRQFIKLV